MKALYNTLKEQPILYVARDVERALGLPADTPGYHILTNDTPAARAAAEEAPEHIHLVRVSEGLKNTYDLLTAEAYKKLAASLKPRGTIVFKNTFPIQRLARENSWPILNPSANLAQYVEDKVTQVEWLGEMSDRLVPFEQKKCRSIDWDGTPFILQFNRAHTGSGTRFIDSAKALSELRAKFPERPAKKIQYVKGPVFTSNNVVAPGGIFLGNISYQITGLAPFTTNAFASVGNDWRLPPLIMSEDQKAAHDELARKIGDRLYDNGWKGLFGIDVIIDEATGELHLLEINARQPASTAFESRLELARRARGEARGISVFEAHLASLLGIETEEPIIPLETGAQLIRRDPKTGDEVRRYQTDESVMAAHNELNEEGQKIAASNSQ